MLHLRNRLKVWLGGRRCLGFTCAGIAIAALSCADTADATLIASHTGASSSSFNNPVARAFGQSFTTPSGSGWNSITVNFYADAASTIPEATGDLYLLTAPYSGTPVGLSSSTTGFIAEATTISGGEHVFASSVQLLGSTQYYIYEDALTPLGGVYADTSGSGGQTLYYTISTGSAFAPVTVSEMNFEVQGAVPEPTATAAVLIPAAIGILRRRRSAR